MVGQLEGRAHDRSPGVDVVAVNRSYDVADLVVVSGQRRDPVMTLLHELERGQEPISGREPARPAAQSQSR